MDKGLSRLFLLSLYDIISLCFKKNCTAEHVHRLHMKLSVYNTLTTIYFIKISAFLFLIHSSFSVLSIEIAQLTSCDSGIAETPETDDSVSTQTLIIVLILSIFTAGVPVKCRFYLFDLFFSICLSSCPQSQSLSAALRSRRKPCELDFEMTKLISNGAYG